LGPRSAWFRRPGPDLISTSYVERQNLTMRIGMRRMTRLTIAFSKKVGNLAAPVSLHFMHHNLARPHKSLADPTPESRLWQRAWRITSARFRKSLAVGTPAVTHYRTVRVEADLLMELAGGEQQGQDDDQRPANATL
jgi:hypothetical protein